MSVIAERLTRLKKRIAHVSGASREEPAARPALPAGPNTYFVRLVFRT